MLLAVYIGILSINGFISCVEGSNLYDQSFIPLDPILKSDIGLLSVNIPPVYIKEKYWLHTIGIEMPCLDDAIKPNLMIITSEMNYSTTALLQMTKNIDFTKITPESQGRLVGPLNSFNQSYNIFLEILQKVRSKYIDISHKHVKLWGLLDRSRCNYKPYNDILEDTKISIEKQLIRNKRDDNNALDPTKHNVINIEGSGHTFIFHHGQSPILSQTPSNVVDNDAELLLGSNTDHLAKKVSESILKDGQMFAKYQDHLLKPEALLKSTCNVNPIKRIKYIRCVVEHSIDESLCSNKYLVCDPQNKRRKRGLFNFLGDVQNSLFGVATDDQLGKLHTIVDDVGNISKLNSQEIVVLRNNTISLSVNMMASMSNLSTNIYSELTSLTNKIQSWATNIEDNVKALDIHVQESAVISTLATATLTLHTYIHLLNDMSIHLNLFGKHYEHLMNIVNHKSFSLSMLPFAHLSDLWKTIDHSLDKHLTIIDNNDRLHTLESNIFQIYTTQTHMIVLIRLPVVLSPQSLTFWDPRTVPIMRQDLAYELSIRDDILIINNERDEWTTMTRIEYAICLSYEGRLCSQSLVWSTKQKMSCHPSLHTDKSSPSSKCLVRKTDVDPAEAPIIVSSDSRTWLISTLGNLGSAILTCTESNGLPTHKGSIEIPVIGLIQIPKHCSLNMGDRVIHSPYSEIGSSTIDLPSLIDDYQLPFDKAIIMNLTMDVPFLLTQHVHKLKKLDVSKDIIFDQSLSDINVLNKRMREENLIYTDKVQKLQYQLSKDEKTYNMSLSGIKSFFSHLSLPELIIPLPSVYNVLIIIWLMYLTYTRQAQPNRLVNSGLASALLPEGLMKHQSFALPTEYGTNGSLNRSHDGNNMSAYTLDHYLVWIPSVCLITMIVLHYHVIKHLTHQVTKLSARLGWIPENKKTIQHAGENKLLIGILLKFYTPWGRKVTRRQVVIQVATLPGRFTSWYADNTKSIKMKTITGVYRRYNTYADMTINWSNICIKSRDFKLIDTCQELPKDVSFLVNDLQSVVKKHLPWFWWRVEAESITHIAISKKSDCEKLYDYSMV